jgi:hypothetical protein
MIMKIFLFQFVNSYASFFYLAFVAKSMGEHLWRAVTLHCVIFVYMKILDLLA